MGKSILLLSLLCAVLLAAASANPAVPKPLPKPVAAAVQKVAAPQQVQAVAADDGEAFFQRCPGNDWIAFRGNCYLFVEHLEYWYEAMVYCKNQKGNLVSIADEAENIFVSKLTYCKKAWIGRYAVNIDYLRNASNYRYTDGLVSSYHAHDFNSIGSIHEPLIATVDLRWINNVYHAKQEFVCKVPNVSPSTPRPQVCTSGWKYLNGYCYQMPNFTATYIEADFYCRGRGAYHVSVHDKEELRAISLMDLTRRSCPLEETWIGLVKLNPCRVEYSTGKTVCFRWSDRSGDYKDYPKWLPDSPNVDRETNCVALKDRNIRSVHCYQRLRFVCKKKSS